MGILSFAFSDTHMRLRTGQGFTLIELMIVMAILGILASIALPAYQEYAKRARVSEGLAMASAAKLHVADFFVRGASTPEPAGYASGYEAPALSENVLGPATPAAAAVGAGINIDPETGEITIPYSTRIAVASSNILVLIPYNGPAGAEAPLPSGVAAFSPPTEGIKWKCRAAGSSSPFAVAPVTAPTLPMKLAPSECR